MNVVDITIGYEAVRKRLSVALMLVAALSVVHAASVLADAVPLVGAPSEAGVIAFAMQWFTEMQAGRTDRSLYKPAYASQVTDEAVRGMSKTLNAYGASPLGAELVQARKIGEQTFYNVKFRFPRGDATSLIFGFDAAGKITAIGIGSLAGD